MTGALACTAGAEHIWDVWQAFRLEGFEELVGDWINLRRLNVKRAVKTVRGLVMREPVLWVEGLGLV